MGLVDAAQIEDRLHPPVGQPRLSRLLPVERTFVLIDKYAVVFERFIAVAVKLFRKEALAGTCLLYTSR